MDRIREQYWEFVRDCAQEAYDRISPKDDDLIDDELSEIAGNTDWTTITHHAVATLLFTENRAAYDEMVGFAEAAASHDSLDSLIENAACCALLADLRNEFRRIADQHQEGR